MSTNRINKAYQLSSASLHSTGSNTVPTPVVISQETGKSNHNANYYNDALKKLKKTPASDELESFLLLEEAKA